MKIYASYMDNAYLLSCDGEIIPVLNHPSESFEFESVIYILSEYGDNLAKKVASEYASSHSEELKQKALSIYDNTWCKVREWEGCSLVTFRITSTDKFNWYNTIVEFLVQNPRYRRAKITVESDKRTGFRKTFWDEVSYEYAISPENETILATTKLK